MSPSFKAYKRFELFNVFSSTGFTIRLRGSGSLKSKSRSKVSSLSFTRAFGSPTDVSEFLSVTSFFMIPSSLTGLSLGLGGDLDIDSDLL